MIPALSLSPVLDLQQIADDTVASAALNKVALSGKEFLCIVVSMLLTEVVEQWKLTLFLHLVNGHSIDHWLNHTTVWGDDQDLVGLDPQGNPFLLPDNLENNKDGEKIQFQYEQQCLSRPHFNKPIVNYW